MNRFFLKIFTRNLSRQGMFPLINIAGLAVGLAVVLLICAYIFNEYSFDQSFTQHQRIYRANTYFSFSGMKGLSNTSSGALAPAAKEEIPGVETAVRIYLQQLVVKAGDVPFKVDRFCWADEDFFRLFNTPFIHGSPKDFARPGMVALSESQAKVLFGVKDPLGEILMLDNWFPIEVRAVYKDFPANSSINFSMIGHFPSAHQSWIYESHWFNTQVETFCLLSPKTDATVVETGMQQLIDKNSPMPPGTPPVFQVRLQPLDNIHLYSKEIQGAFTVNHGDIGRVKLFSLLAAIILLVACINYMNLSTARAQKRSKEIGVSKTLGAKRKELIVRLYSETGMLTFLSFGVAVVLALMALPVFNLMSGQNIQPDIFINSKFLMGMLLVYLVTTFIAASYPALYLSGFAPMTVIRQAVFTKGSAHALVRKGLSIVQFSVATILIALVVIIHTQLNYMNNKDLGYNVQHVVGISIPNQSVLDAFRNDYLAQESVSSAAFTTGFPFGGHSGRPLFKTLSEMHNPKLDNNIVMLMTKTTPEAIDLLRIKLIAGTTLPERIPGDTITSIIINSKTVEYLETTPEEIVGKRLPVQFNQQMYVCGVVEDFHFQSLHEPVTPFGFHNWDGQKLMNLLLKVKEGNLSQQLLTYEGIFKRHFPNDLFEVHYPELNLAYAYKEDRQTGYMVLSFSILAILVACMGVFGLSAFMAEQRTKEIGIRKVFGASVSSIVRLFTDNYLRLLALSLIIALPIAWWIGGKYLENFAYRITLSWWIFVAAALIVIVLTLCTVGYQAIKAATANPVKAIKSE